MICPKCGKRRAKDSPCKFCHRIHVTKHQNSLHGKLLHRFRAIKQRCQRAGWNMSFDKADFVDWSMRNGYPELHANWVASGYSVWLTPSVDRIDEVGGYVFANMQWITWKENYEKECKRTGARSPFEAQSAPPPTPDDDIPDWL